MALSALHSIASTCFPHVDDLLQSISCIICCTCGSEGAQRGRRARREGGVGIALGPDGCWHLFRACLISLPPRRISDGRDAKGGAGVALRSRAVPQRAPLVVKPYAVATVSLTVWTPVWLANLSYVASALLQAVVDHNEMCSRSQSRRQWSALQRCTSAQSLLWTCRTEALLPPYRHQPDG